MQDSKLDALLATMDVFELKRFGRFLASPYHNEDEKMVQLYEYLMPHYKARTTGAPDKLKAWKIVYGKKPFANLKYARLLSDLLKRAESFITIERMKRKGADESNFLLDEYNDRGLVKHFTEPYIYARQQLEKAATRDRDYYYHAYQLHAHQNMHIENRKERTTDKQLTETVQSLDTYYLINKLRYSAALLHYRHFLNVSDEFAMLEEVLRHAAEKPLPPVGAVYHYAVLTLMEPDREEHFMKLKETLFKEGKVLHMNTQTEAFDFAISYCIRKINQGKPTYQAEIFGLYKDALERGLMVENGVMNPWNYKNIVTIGLRNKDYKWTDAFIEKYVGKLKKSEQKNAHTFNRARYYFATGKYDKVLKLLQDVEYTDIFYLLDAKTTLMKTYYELGEYEPLLSLKESFRILLRRKKLISDQNRVNYGNFARLTMKLYRADVKNKVQMASLKKEMEETSNMADRTWLLEKYAALLG